MPEEGLSLEPKPCPFCGAVPDVWQDLGGRDVWIVVCRNFASCEIRPATKWFESFDGRNGRDRAVMSWNKRAVTELADERQE